MRRTGKDNVIRRVLEFQQDEVTSTIVTDVNDVMLPYDEDTVRTASAGAATFYCWVMYFYRYSRIALIKVDTNYLTTTGFYVQACFGCVLMHV